MTCDFPYYQKLFDFFLQLLGNILKLRLVVNEHGEILTFQLTPGNVDDRKPVPFLSKDLFGKLFADRGYNSHDLFAKLFQEDDQLITGIRKNMQNRLMPWVDKLLLRKR